MGRNGMGKSTLLKSLMGLVKPRWTDRARRPRHEPRPAYEIAQLGIAYVPEGRGIFGNLSVENLQMAAAGGRGRAPTGPTSACWRPFRAWASGWATAANCPAASSRC